MPSFLEHLRSQSALGLHDKFTDVGSVESALEDNFLTLCSALNPGLNLADHSLIFSVDSYNASVDASIEEQVDNFAEQVFFATGLPHAKICHMRHYSNATGAHWHALFAQMDEKGELQSITITDSRLKAGLISQGITAQPDIENNPFLKTNSSIIQFIPGLSQPPHSSSCWIYALANLASLASTGRVYLRQKQAETFGNEIASLIKPTPKPIQIQTPNAVSPSNLIEIPRVTEGSGFFTPLRRSPSSNPEEEGRPEIKKHSSGSYLGGAGLALLGTAVITVGILALSPILPFSLTAAVALVVIGSIVLLAGAAMMTLTYLKNRESEQSLIQDSETQFQPI